MLGAVKSNSRVTAPPPIRLCSVAAREVDMPRSGFSPFAPAWISPCDISIILLASQINERSASPAGNNALELKVIFCVRGVLSPLLSNLYMRRFVLGWKRLGYEQRFGGHIVTYADDLVICCKRGAEEALASMRQIMQRLRLTVNEEKTHVCCVPEQYFDFLGYQFGGFYSEATGKAYFGKRPSKKSVKRLIEAIHEQTTRKTRLLEADEVVASLNRKLRLGQLLQIGSGEQSLSSGGSVHHESAALVVAQEASDPWRRMQPVSQRVSL